LLRRKGVAAAGVDVPNENKELARSRVASKKKWRTEKRGWRKVPHKKGMKHGVEGPHVLSGKSNPQASFLSRMGQRLRWGATQIGKHQEEHRSCWGVRV